MPFSENWICDSLYVGITYLKGFLGRSLGSPVSASDLYFKCVNRMELVFLLFKPSNCASKDSSGSRGCAERLHRSHFEKKRL